MLQFFGKKVQSTRELSVSATVSATVKVGDTTFYGCEILSVDTRKGIYTVNTGFEVLTANRENVQINK